MKKRFHEGEEVVCIDKTMRPATEAAKNAPALKYNNLYVIDKYVHFKYGVWWVSIVGIASCCIYSEMSLAPVTQIEELMEEVEYREVISPDWGCDQNDPNRWKGW